jgi:hypothetical protein
MSSDAEKLEQILNSTFGLAFLAHLLDLQPHPILIGAVSTGEISRRAEEFRLRDLRRSLIEIFAEFIRDYPFGLTHDWIRLSQELRSAKDELGFVLSKAAPELLNLGFTSGFEENNQFAVQSDAYSQTENYETRWKPIAGAWWTHPNTLPTFQALSGDLKNFAIDDAMVFPTSMTKYSRVVSSQVFEIQSGQEWLELVEEFPLETEILHLENWLFSYDPPKTTIWIPDWRQVAKNYGGVYLSPAAYLGASYEFLELPDGRITFLSGWSPGSTFWLPQAES